MIRRIFRVALLLLAVVAFPRLCPAPLIYKPGEGWSYDNFLSLLSAKPTATAIEFGQFLTKSYVDAYNGGSYGHQDVTFSAIDLNAYPQFVAAIKEFGMALGKLSLSERRKVVSTINMALSFTYSDYVDVGDFVNRLQVSNITALDAELLSKIRKAMANFVVT